MIFSTETDTADPGRSYTLTLRAETVADRVPLMMLADKLRALAARDGWPAACEQMAEYAGLAAELTNSPAGSGRRT